MPDFFDRLVARAAPPDSALRQAAGMAWARPGTPSLFERPGPPMPESPTEPLPFARLAEPGMPSDNQAPPPARPTDRPEPAAPSRQLSSPPVASPATQWPDREPTALPPVVPAAAPTVVPVPVAALGGVAATPAPPDRSRDTSAGPAPAPHRVTTRAAGPLTPPAGPPMTGAVSRREQQPRPAERTVHVRIGRIEVTAPTPAVPPARSRPPRRAPALTLARYLDRDAADQDGRRA
jgi:hypothetical protein